MQGRNEFSTSLDDMCYSRFPRVNQGGMEKVNILLLLILFTVRQDISI